MGRLETFIFDWSYYWMSVLTFAFSMFMYFYVSPAISYRLVPAYRHFDKDKKITWNSYTVSTLFGIVTSCLCIYNFVFDDEIRQDKMWCDSKLVRSTCAIVCGYMVTDVCLTLKNFKQYGEIGYLFHHFATFYSYFYVVTFGILSYFANFRLMAEFSTAFVNMRWLLDAVGYNRSSDLYMLNGIVMTLVFYGSRIFTMPYCWFNVYLIWGTDDFIRLGHTSLVMLFSLLVLDILNIYWAYRMYLGVRKVLSKFTTKHTAISNGVKSD